VLSQQIKLPTQILLGQTRPCKCEWPYGTTEEYDKPLWEIIHTPAGNQFVLRHHHVSCKGIYMYRLMLPPSVSSKFTSWTWSTRPAGVAQSVERVALIISWYSQPQGRGFEPLLRLFLQQAAHCLFLSFFHYVDVVGEVCKRVMNGWFFFGGGAWAWRTGSAWEMRFNGFIESYLRDVFDVCGY
jgi:hypothetical protein